MNERELFDAALALADPGERSSYLDRACGADQQLRDHLCGLLEAHDKLGGFLQRPLPVGDATLAQSPGPKASAVIGGRYRLLELIGEGGMGTVWVAEQTEPVRRRVALKLIKPGMDTRQVLSRFEAERQALALMDHPNIARVFDGGMTDEGRPFFVMEYVKGLPLTQYCDDTRLTVAERLALFTQVCQAVQHAHQKGIIHRDLKPSNILVCLYDGQPVPKVIDFGLAKAMHQSLTEHTLYTAHGLMVGTPLYMSPEQAEFNNLDIDTRSDIYSLGVILYELLTGTTPLEMRQFKDAAWQEMVRLIKEQEPPRPSTRLSGSGSLPSLAAQRRLDPARLTRTVRGELDWIVMKALEKDRGRRYETASGLARDVQRYLADEPVVAGPPSVSYRLRKFVRRHTLAVLTISVVVLFVAGFSVFSGLMWWKSHQSGRALERVNQDLVQANVDLTASGAEVRQANALNVRLASEAQRQVRATSAMYFAARSQIAREQSPLQSLLLAIEAVEVTRKRGEPVAPAARHSLHDALRSVGGIALTWHGNAHPSMTDMRLSPKKLKYGLGSVAMSPDGRWLATSDVKGIVRLWDISVGAPWIGPILLSGHEGTVYSATFSHDSRWLVTAGADRTLRRWDLTAVDVRSSSIILGKDLESVELLAFSPRGRWLASVGAELNAGREEGTVRIWNMQTDAPNPIRMPLEEPDGDLSGRGHLDFILSPDGPWMIPPLTRPQDKLRVWNLDESGRISRRVQYESVIEKDALIQDATISRSGRWFVAASVSRFGGDSSKTAIYAWQIAPDGTQNPPAILHIDGEYHSIHISPDDRHLIATSFHRAGFHRWDLAAEDLQESLQVVPGSGGDGVTTSTISPNSRWLIAGSYDGTVRTWDLKAESPEATERVLRGHKKGETLALVVSSDSHWMVSASEEVGVRLWDLTSDDPTTAVRVLRGHDGSISYAGFGTMSRWLVTAGVFDGVVRLWDPSNANLGETELILRTTGIDYNFKGVLISPDGRWLAGPGSPPRLWDLGHKSPPNTLQEMRGHGGPAYPVALSLHYLVTAAKDESPILWTLSDASGSRMQRLVGKHDWRLPAAISPDERWVVTGIGDAQPRLWRLTGHDAEVQSKLLHYPFAESNRRGSVGHITISRDGRWLCIGYDEYGNDSSSFPAVLFDLTAQEPAGTASVLNGHRGGITSQAFSSDGRWLVTGSRGRTVRLWDLRSGNGTVKTHLLSLESVKYQGSSRWVPHVNIALSPSGNWLATKILGGDRTEIWNLKSGAPPSHSFVLHDQLNVGSDLNTFFSPDDRWVVAKGFPNARLLDLRQDNPIDEMRDIGSVNAAAFSPDGESLLLANSMAMTTMLFDMRADDPMATGITLCRDQVWSVSISPDTRWLVASTMHGETRLWHLKVDELIVEARLRAGRPLTPNQLNEMSPIMSPILPGVR